MAQQAVILYIEDDKDDVEILAGVFEIMSPAHKIINAINGEKGIEKLKELQTLNKLPCLIVLDINTPKMNGKETILALKKII
ncbi:MAG: hypothetical protein C4329_03175 [Chitinophagaceae bacterium]